MQERLIHDDWFRSAVLNGVTQHQGGAVWGNLELITGVVTSFLNSVLIFKFILRWLILI